MKKTTDQDDNHNDNAACPKIASPSSKGTQLSPARAKARPEGISSHQENENNELQIHIHITESGEICAWGLDQEGEERIFSLTGNPDLINKYKTMAYNLCG